MRGWSLLAYDCRLCTLGEQQTGFFPFMKASHTVARQYVPGKSRAIRTLNTLIRQVAPTDASVLITGESGAGKEVVAEVIHGLSRRAQRAFIALNCGAISPNLIESELFGHERGSFTGAVSNHKGHFERADGGTLFLDEITEMPIDLQVKLLRVLETGRFMRVGSQRERLSDVRIIAATNRPPDEAIATGCLREDLFYRLQVFPIHIPPLRERQSDVPLLAQAFLDEINRDSGTRKRFTPEALQRLRGYSWPGNVRQLKNAVYRAHIVAAECIDVDSLDPALMDNAPPGSPHITIAIGSTIAEAEHRLIVETLRSVAGNKEQAARILGISSKTLYNRLKSYRLGGVL